jgi:hypothetical protein
MARRRDWRDDPDPLAVSGWLDEAEDLLDSPVWKLVLFRVNGWPRLPADCTEQAWRPWHRLYGRRDGRSAFPPWRCLG